MILSRFCTVERDLSKEPAMLNPDLCGVPNKVKLSEKYSGPPIPFWGSNKVTLFCLKNSGEGLVTPKCLGFKARPLHERDKLHYLTKVEFDAIDFL